MKKSKKNYLIIALVVLLLALAVGYAAFSDQLIISGTANAKGTFDLEFVQAGCAIVTDTAKGIDTVNSSATVSSDKNTLTVVVKDLAYQGAGTQVTAQIKNVGTVPAKLNGLNFTGIDDSIIEVKFPDGLVTGEVLQPNGTCDITFYVQWKDGAELPEDVDETKGYELSFSATLDYVQEVESFEANTTSHADTNP